MEQKKNIIPIVFATNENYAPYAGVTITSIIENSSKEYFYDIYIFYTELSQETLDKFESMRGDNYSVTCLNVNSHLDSAIGLYENFHYSKEMYYRILIPSILSQYSKVIYLDCDIVVLGDLSDFYNIDIDGYILGGVSDVQHYESKQYVIDKLNIDPNTYINSGVLLINCEEFNKQNIKNKCFEILNTINIKLRYPDQDIINIACAGKIKYLKPCWNYIWHANFIRSNRKNLQLSLEEQKEYDTWYKDIKILHYTSGIKPWNNYNIELSKHFFNYVNKTKEFKSIIIERYNSIKMKNYITLQTADLVGDKLYIYGAFYSIENYLYKNNVFVNINKIDYKLNFIESKFIDLRKNCYVQNFFRIILDLKDFKYKKIEARFFRKNFPNEKLPVLTGRNFPINNSINIRTYFKNYEMYLDNKSLILKHTLTSVKKNEKIVRKSLKKIKSNETKWSLRLRRLYFFTKSFIKKDIWLISDRMNSAGDNGEAFFKYVVNQKNKRIKPYFVIEKKSKDYARMKKIGRVIDPNSIKFKFLFLHCKQIISSHLPWELIKPYNTTYLKDLFFGRKIVFLQHGIIKDDLTDAYSGINQGMNLFVTSAKEEYKSITQNPRYYLPGPSVILTGLPRYDDLVDDRKNVICLMPTWRQNVSKLFETNPEEAYQSEFYKFYNDLILDKKLELLLKKYNYKLKFVPHPMCKALFNNIKIGSNRIEMVTENISYNQIFKEGSLLITDYSSVAFDFAYLHKPLIYCQFDADTIMSSHTYKKGYFEYERDGLGPVVYNKKDLLRFISKCLKNKCINEQMYEDRITKFYKYTDRNNSKRIYNRLITYLTPKKKNILVRCSNCLKENGFKYTIKRIFAKIFRRK